MLRRWPSEYVLRPWQEEFFTDYSAKDKEDYLLVATPGAGKTIASLKIAHTLLNSGLIKQIVVVCPTDYLRTQWLNDADSLKIDLDKFQTGWNKQLALTADFVGFVTTYQQVLSQKELMRSYASKEKTLVIFDEIHHCGDLDKLSSNTKPI